jgi:hypothetical protein
MNLQIAAILHKKYALTQEDAELVFSPLDKALKASQRVDLSFGDLENCSTIFLRFTLGRLYLTYGPKVDEYVSIKDISPENEVLPNQIKRLKERAAHSEQYQAIFNQALGEA